MVEVEARGTLRLEVGVKSALTLISLKILPMRKTRTTRRSVGEMGRSIMMSSMRMPNIDASTNRKSNTFQGTVK